MREDGEIPASAGHGRKALGYEEKDFDIGSNWVIWEQPQRNLKRSQKILELQSGLK